MFSNGFRKEMTFKNEETASETVSCTRESEIHQKMCGMGTLCGV